MAVFLLAARADLPSMATGISPVASHAAAIHRPNARANASGSSLAKTRSKVSGLGMPLASGRNRRKNASLVPAVLGDRLPRLGPADDGAGGDDQDVGQGVELVPGVAAGVGQVGEDGRERQGRHGESSWLPRYSRKPLCRQQFIVRRALPRVLVRRCRKSCWAPLPLTIERGGLVGPHLTALIAFMKGVCHASYSTIRTFLRDCVGVTLARSTLANTIDKVSQALERPYEELLRQLPAEDCPQRR